MNFHNVYISPRSIEYVTRALETGYISEGRAVAEFEAGLAKLGLTNPVATNSGTAALHLALILAGVGPGDEVIIPAQTFVATGTAVLQCGATPVFVDIDPETGDIDPEDIDRRITDETRAIIPVHYGGLPCAMSPIHATAKNYALAVIEDAAHALGAAYNRLPVGSLSEFTAFSFQAIKHLTTGDGGALCSENKYDSEAVRRLRWFGIGRGDNFSELGNRQYSIVELGYKYHMNDIAACIGLGNLEFFAQRLSRRKKLGAYYRASLADIDGLKLLRVDPECEHAYWLFTVLVENRLEFVRAMAARGVPVSVVHRRIDDNPIFGGRRDDLPGTDYFDEHQVSIPVHDGLTDEDVYQVVNAIQDGWA